MTISQINKSLLSNWDKKGWKTAIRKAKKSLGWTGVLDVGHIYDMATEIMNRPERFPELVELIHTYDTSLKDNTLQKNAS
jgi:hypothetical protein